MRARHERLTVGLIRALQPGATDRVVWDTEVPRLAFRVRPTGGRSYMVRLVVNGRQRWYTLGKHGDPWTPDLARDEARRILGQAVNVEGLRRTGQAPLNLRHPIEARDHTKGAATLADFAKRYIEFALAHKRASTAAADEGNLRRAILPALGHLRLDAITRSDVARFHIGRQAKPTNANRCLALISHMMVTAERWGLRPENTNPCRYVERFPEKKRERFLSGEELARFGAALDEVEAAGKVTPFGIAAIRLLVFTGARASEILGLTWDAVNSTSRTARIAQTKSGGPRTLILNPPAVEVLKGLHPVRGNPHVMAGGRPGAALTLSGLEQVWQEVRRVGLLEDVRLHDLRHTYASVAVAGGASLPIIGGLLGHTQPSTTARYAHLSHDPLKATSDAVGESIASAMEGMRIKPRAKAAQAKRSRS